MVLPPKPRVLLGAQPFGFGPAAAAARLADGLAPVCAKVAYFGMGHTLDLQATGPYYQIYDTADYVEDERLATLTSLASEYDLFIAVMDFLAADHALRAGIPTVIYDYLTWFWPNMPPVAREVTRYVAQDFFGVRERIAADASIRGHSVIVPPTAPQGLDWRPEASILVNLGGLQNPFWGLDDAIAYARLMLSAIRDSLPPGTSFRVATSRQVAAAFNDPEIGTYSYAVSLKLLSAAKLAFMTPGLGNIYDVAAVGTPTLWLPPANLSQALQSRLIAQGGYCDARIDWEDLGYSIGYEYGTNESDFSAPLANAIREIANFTHGHRALVSLIRKQREDMASSRTSRTRGLLKRFGHCDLERTVMAVLNH